MFITALHEAAEQVGLLVSFGITLDPTTRDVTLLGSSGSRSLGTTDAPARYNDREIAAAIALVQAMTALADWCGPDSRFAADLREWASLLRSHDGPAPA